MCLWAAYRWREHLNLVSEPNRAWCSFNPCRSAKREKENSVQKDVTITSSVGATAKQKKQSSPGCCLGRECGRRAQERDATRAERRHRCSLLCAAFACSSYSSRRPRILSRSTARRCTARVSQVEKVNLTLENCTRVWETTLLGNRPGLFFAV